MSIGPHEIRFSADAMVQSLAKWLRLLGYDCIAGNEWFGRKLIEHAVAEDRWVLSRNTKLAHYLPPELLQRVRLHSVQHEPLPQQVREIVQTFDLDTQTFLFTRCVECNAPLRQIAPDGLTSEVPMVVLANHRLFWKCDQCGRIFWQGSHVQRSIERLHSWVNPAGT